MKQLRFLDYHKPVLKAGDYRLSVQTTVKAKDEKHDPPEVQRDFRVDGPRYHLKPQDIVAVYPPADSAGDYATVLPHVVLSRATIPWERAVDKAETAPWLAVLVLDEEELSEVKVQTIAQSDLDPGAPGDARVRVLDGEVAFLAARLPRFGELRLLAHVRERLDKKGSEKPEISGEVAVVMAGRLPHASAMGHAFLVSVEGAYGDSGAFDASRLVVLKSWRFAAGDPAQSFTERMKRLDASPLVLRSPTTPPADDPGGASLFAYRMRNGSRTAAFYRGPLAAGDTPPPDDVLPDAIPLPELRAADSLVRYRSELGVFDVTYAAAWELGRLLALASGSFARTLIRWKHAAKTTSLAADAERDLGHLDFRDKTSKKADPTPPEEVTGLLERLASLEAVPLSYLLPEPAALPKDAIRFFQIDQYWLDCLLEGAFGIGRFLEGDHAHEAALRHALDSVNRPRSGFLLRSSLVGDFPGLTVKASSADENEITFDLRRLAPDLLLCLFDKAVTAVELHLASEALHSGVDSEGASKTLRRADGTPAPKGDGGAGFKSVPLPPNPSVPPRAARVLSVEALQNSLAAQAAELGFSHQSPSSYFAFQMIQTVKHIRFKLS